MQDQVLSLVTMYQERGPVFEFGGMLVLAGRQANLLLAQTSEERFLSRPVHTHFLRELGTEYFVVALDGAPHRHMRGIMRPAFHRAAIEGYAPRIVQATAQMVEGWQRGQQLEMAETFRRLIIEQTALVMAHWRVADEYASISRFFRTAVAGIFGRIAPQALHDPEYVAAKGRVFALARDMVREHRAFRTHTEPDYIDLLLTATDESGQPLSEQSLLAASLVPFFAGIDTVAHTCAYLLRTLLNRDDLMRAVTSEVDEAFQSGDFSLTTLRQMTTFQRVTMETMRMYPAAPYTVRWIREGFEFEGHRLEANQPVMIAGPVTHFLPELFLDPLKFDPDRFADPRNEHRQPGAFVPFSTGPHACIGSHLGEVQTMVTVATLLHLVRLTLDLHSESSEPADARTPRNGAGYTARVLDVRKRPAT